MNTIQQVLNLFGYAPKKELDNVPGSTPVPAYNPETGSVVKDALLYKIIRKKSTAAKNKVVVANSQLSIVYSARMKRSWRLKINPDGTRILTAPAILNSAPQEVVNALRSWGFMVSKYAIKNQSYKDQKRLYEKTIADYINSISGPANRNLRSTANFANSSLGTFFDLSTIFAELNKTFFGDKLHSYLRWGKPLSKLSSQSHFFDQDGIKQNLITIAGVYNLPSVPEYAVRGVLFHEMIHIAIPPYKVNGKMVFHGREFKEFQKRYPQLLQWQKWERHTLPKLLTTARKQHFR